MTRPDFIRSRLSEAEVTTLRERISELEVENARLQRAARVSRDPTEAMLVAARDWSYVKYGAPVGDDAATGCWRAMFDAALALQPGDPT